MNAHNHPSCSCGCSGGHACDCCLGPHVLTPAVIFNPSGLSALQRRAGTWDTFRRTMQARLSDTIHFPALQNLTTREPSDPSMAFLDAAAVVCDVLTFYTERCANEGYLRTATERRSLMELGKLIGYRPRPGVAASAWLAFTLDAGYAIEVPAGTRVQSVPAKPDQSAQTFETSAAISARAEFNAMPARRSIPQEISPANVLNVETLWLQGIGLNLKPGDMLLFVFPDDEAASTPRKIHAVTEDAAAQRTAVKLVVEKLSAAYHVPVLRKAAQALRQTIPDDWLSNDRKWAKNVAASLDAFTAALTSDTSLIQLEKLFLPPQPQGGAPAKGLTELLEAVTVEGDQAGAFSGGLAARAAWKESLQADWTKIFERARAEERLLGHVFPLLRFIDLHAADLNARQGAARDIASLLDEGSATEPGDITQCFPSVQVVLRNLRESAKLAAAASEAGWDTIGLGPASPKEARTAVDALGIKSPEETARKEAMVFLGTAQASLATDVPAVAEDLLDSNNGKLQNLIDAATGTAPSVATLLQDLQAAFSDGWTPLEDLMRLKLEVASATDPLLADIATKNHDMVADLADETEGYKNRAKALEKMAGLSGELLLGGTGQPETKTTLTRIALAGTMAKSLITHRRTFQTESVSGLQRAILLLTGRYKNSVANNATVAAELRRLETKARAVSDDTTLSGLNAELQTSLGVVNAALETASDLTLDRLRAEMQILSGQVAVSPSGAGASSLASPTAAGAALGSIVDKETLKQPAAPGDPLAVPRSLGAFVSSSFDAGGVASDAVSRLAARLAGSSDDELFSAWRKLNTGQPPVEVYAMRVQAAVFGNGAPMRFGPDADRLYDNRFKLPSGDGDWAVVPGDLDGTIRLDGELNKVVRDSYVVIERPRTVEVNLPSSSDIVLLKAGALAMLGAAGGIGFSPGAIGEFMALKFFNDLSRVPILQTVEGKNYVEAVETRVRRVQDVLVAPHSAYSLSGKATTVTLLQESEWGKDDTLGFGVIRRTRVHAASELLTLAEMPVDRVTGLPGKTDNGKIVRSADNPFCETDDVLMLDGLYQGLAPGQRLIIAGQRADNVSARSVREYALVSKVEHVLVPTLANPEAPLPGDTPHTRVTLSAKLQYQYRRDTVVVYGNVAEATHGETKRETLGSGNARAASLKFPLRSVPVTYVAAATASGAASTVQLRVDRILWRETDEFTTAGPDDRIYVLEMADDGSTNVVFGDGQQGARPPTGQANVTAVYRSGIGQAGNVGAESLTSLLDRPLGLKEVKNPLGASGGADRDGAEDIRRNAPLPLLALDRLVSVSDYADFSRAFAGIGKAEAALIGGAGGGFVHVTIAGQNDAPIDDASMLMTSLTEALITLGDPLLPVRVQVRELLVLMLAARVRILPEYEWAAVEPALRTAVGASFGFLRRNPGQDIFLSEVVSVMQGVPGVDFVDVDTFGGIPEKTPDADGRRPLRPEELEEAIKALIGAAPSPRISVELAGYDAMHQLRPAQLALFLPDMPETLILNQFVS